MNPIEGKVQNVHIISNKGEEKVRTAYLLD